MKLYPHFLCSKAEKERRLAENYYFKTGKIKKGYCRNLYGRLA